MKQHRFFVPQSSRELRHELWIDDQHLVHHWQKNLKLGPGDELVLFDGVKHERLYRVDKVEQTAYKLQHVTDLVITKPKVHVYLFWPLLSASKNNLIIKECTELGVSNFVPIYVNIAQAKNIDIERLKKTTILAAEQSGRGDIPSIHEPMSLESALGTYKNKLSLLVVGKNTGDAAIGSGPYGLLVESEDGWSSDDQDRIERTGLASLSVGESALSTETACIAATAKVLA